MNGFPNIYKNINEVHLEVTNSCNLGCKYCYVSTKHKQKIDDSDHMNIQIVKDIVERMAKNTIAANIKVVFHGGEPLLLNSQWYEKVLPKIEDICSLFNKNVTLSMQTNLTLLNNTMLNLIKKHKIIISTSIDGPQEVHDAYKNLFQKTSENLAKINRLGLLGGVITVFHFHNYDKVSEIIKTLKNLRIKRFLVNFAYTMGRGKKLPCLDADKRFKVYKDLIDYMIETKGKEIIEQTTLIKLKRFINPPNKSEWLRNLSCYTPFCHAGIRMLMFKSNGDVYPCGFSGGLGTNEYFKLGNIYNMDENCFRKKIIRFHKKNDEYLTECQSCEAKTICFFGCPGAEYEDNLFKNENCNANKQLFTYLCLKKDRLQKLFVLQGLRDEHIFN